MSDHHLNHLATTNGDRSRVDEKFLEANNQNNQGFVVENINNDKNEKQNDYNSKEIENVDLTHTDLTDRSDIRGSDLLASNIVGSLEDEEKQNSKFVIPPKIISSITTDDVLPPIESSTDLNRLLDLDASNELADINPNKRCIGDASIDENKINFKRQQTSNPNNINESDQIISHLDVTGNETNDVNNSSSSHITNTIKIKNPKDLYLKFERTKPTNTSIPPNPPIAPPPKLLVSEEVNINGSNIELVKAKIIKFTPNKTSENIKKPHLLLTNPNSKKAKREPTKGPPKNSRFFKIYSLETGGTKTSKPSSIHHYNPYRYPQNRSKLNPHPDFIRSKNNEPSAALASTDKLPASSAPEGTSSFAYNVPSTSNDGDTFDSVSKYEKKIPELTPTMEEFEDIYSYIDSIKEIGQKYGAVKIIPPKEFSPKFAINLESFWIKTKRQLWRSTSEELNSRCEFYKQLRDYFKDSDSVSINKLPCIDKRAIDLYRLYRIVKLRGGFENCCNDKLWAQIGRELGFYGKISSSLSSSIKSVYQKYIIPWEKAYEDKKEQDFLAIARNDENNSLLPAEKARGEPDVPVILGSDTTFTRNRNTLINAGFSTYYDQATTQKRGITLNDLNTLPGYDFYRWSDPLSPDDTNPTDLKISSLYTLKQFHDKSRILKSQLLNKFDQFEHLNFENLNYLENTYWKLLENPEVMYETEVALGQSTNLHDSTYENRFVNDKNLDLSDSILAPLNFNNTTVSDGSLLQYVNCDSESIFHSYLNFCMFYGTESWHLEDHWFYKLDYHYLGDAKSVYVIPPEFKEKYEALVKDQLEARDKERIKTDKTYGLFDKEISNYDILSACLENLVAYDMTLPRSKPNDLVFENFVDSEKIPIRYNSNLMFTPKYLEEHGIPVYHTFQEVGDMIIKFPKAYSAYFSLGTSVTESVNVANCDWLVDSLKVTKWLQEQSIPPKFSTFAMLLTAARESNDVHILENIKDILEKTITEEISKRKQIRSVLNEVKFCGDCNIIKRLNDIRVKNDTNLLVDESENENDDDEATVGTKLAFKLGNWNKVTDYDLVDMFPTFVCAKNIGNKQSMFTISLDAYLEKFAAKSNTEGANTSSKYIFELVSLVDDDYLLNSLIIIKEKLQSIKEWFTKYHEILNKNALPTLDQLLPLYKQGQTIFNEKNLKLDKLDLIEEHALKEFKQLECEINRTENWRKKVKLFFKLRSKCIGKSISFNRFKELVDEMKNLTISVYEMKDMIKLSKEIIEFDNVATEALKSNKLEEDNELLEKLHNTGKNIKVALTSFRMLDKVVQRSAWLNFVKSIDSTENLKNAIELGKKFSPTIEEDIKLLQNLEDKLSISEEVLAEYARVQKEDEKVNSDVVKSMFSKCEGLPLEEIKEYFGRMINEYNHIRVELIPFIKLLEEKNVFVRRRKDFGEKVEVYLKYHDLINSNMSIENIESSLWGLNKFTDFESEFKTLNDQIIEGPENVSKEINLKFQQLLNFGKDNFKFSNMSKSDCLNYLTSYNLELLNSNDDRYCVCRQLHEGNMVECEVCKEWFHFNCIGYESSSGSTEDSSRYICPLCDYEEKYATTKKYYSDLSLKIKFEDLIAFASKMMMQSSILSDYEVTFLEISKKFYQYYLQVLKSGIVKKVKDEDSNDEKLVADATDNDGPKLRKFLQKLGACTINFEKLQEAIRSKYCELCAKVAKETEPKES